MKNFTGFTILELLVTLVLIAILCSIGVPSYQYLLARSHADNAITSLFRAIQLARSEAIKHNAIVTVCGSNKTLKCLASWSSGYLVFVDYRMDGRVNSADSVIQYFKGPKKYGKLVWKGFPNKPFLQFTPQGFARYQNGTFRYYPNDQNPHFFRALIVSQSGRLRFVDETT